MTSISSYSQGEPIKASVSKAESLPLDSTVSFLTDFTDYET